MLDRALIQQCPLCGDKARSPWLFGLGFELVRCDACGHRYSTSVHSQAILKAPSASSLPTRGLQDRFGAYLRLLGSSLPERARVLAVGSHASEVLQLFRSRHAPAPRADELAKLTPVDDVKRSGAAIWQKQVEASLPHNECFELVVLAQVLERIHEPGALLRRLRGTLSARGRLLVEVPNADDRLLSLWRSAYRPLSAGDHVSFFDAPHLKALLSRHGFVLEGMIAPTSAHDLVYTNVESALDAARAAVGRPRAPEPEPRLRCPPRVRWPLRAAVDACLSALDPAVKLACATGRAELRGPTLMAVARVAA